MCNKLDLLLKEYDQAIQNFQWAEKNHVLEAIQNLCVLEYFIEKEFKKAKRG